MTVLRIWLAVVFLIVSVYTGIVITRHGWDLLPIFFGDMSALSWSGQFNLDFFGMLSLSALYLVWRHHFTPVGWLVAAGGLFLGAPFLCLYLLVASIGVRGDVVRLLIGDLRAAELRG